MKNKNICYLDLDGVIANFSSAALASLGVKEYSIPKGEWNIENWNGVNVTTSHFWKTIDSLGESFWENLEKFSYSDEMVKYLSKNYDLYFLTSPSKSPHCYSGKYKWIIKHYPHMERRIILTPNKHLLAAPNRLLIDDSEEKIDKFAAYGGETILLPQKYNRGWEEFFMGHFEDQFDYVLQKLEELNLSREFEYVPRKSHEINE